MTSGFEHTPFTTGRRKLTFGFEHTPFTTGRRKLTFRFEHPPFGTERRYICSKHTPFSTGRRKKTLPAHSLQHRKAHPKAMVTLFNTEAPLLI